MKKLLLSVLILVSFIACLFGQEVDTETIKTVALNASRSYNPSSEDSIKISKILPISKEINNIGYIVNFSDNSLVILSGDYSIQPVLGHSLNGPFSWDNVPPGLDYLLRKYEAGIKYSREHHLKPTLETAELWQALKKNYVSNNSTKSSVNPLMDTKWDQSPDFNNFCPEDDESIYSNDKCPAGCSAIALSQILKFWSCRVDKGIGLTNID